MVRTLIDFAPAELAIAPRPLEGELTSSWLYRVAAANLVELEELLSGLLDLHPEVHSSTNICLDYGIAPAWSRAKSRSWKRSWSPGLKLHRALSEWWRFSKRTWALGPGTW